ncbi:MULTISPECIES: FtsK/SpoIIIE domain-containing protein [Latilactobacillus]|nr:MULTISPECIES: FtsK/SpoIIIE domain-containing protein [Latilactobacillus]MCP8851825.1 cell division protein FtsK [Latilactobacillus sakei]
MIQLLVEYYQRKKGKEPLVSWKQPNGFLHYKGTLRKIFFYIFSLETVLLFLAMLSGNTFWMLAFLLLIILSIPRLFKLLKKMKQVFKIEFNYDYLLLCLMYDNDIPETATLSYFTDGDNIGVVAFKSSNMKEDKLLDSLDSGLETLLSLPLIDKFSDTNKIVYLLGEEQPLDQWVFSSDDLTKELFSDVPLDIIPLSNTISFSLSKSSMLGLYGRTGSGKTIALQWYLYQAIAKGCGTDPRSQLSIVDGKGADLFALGELIQENLGSEHISIGSSPNMLAKLAREFVDEMNSRFEIIKHQGALNADAYDLNMTPNFLFIDELASIKDECGSSKDGKNLWQEILGYLGLIAKKGRQAACHLVISTQDPNAENIPSEIRLQITSIIFLGQPSKDRLNMAFSMCDLEEVPTPPSSKGGGLFYADGLGLNEPLPIIAPFVDVKTKSDFLTIITRIAPNKDNFI